MGEGAKPSGSFRKDPRVPALIMLAFGVVWILIGWPPLREAAKGAGSEAAEAVGWGLILVAAAAVSIGAASAVRKRWWVKSTLRSAIILLVYALPLIGSVAIMPSRTADEFRPGDVICDSWPNRKIPAHCQARVSERRGSPREGVPLGGLLLLLTTPVVAVEALEDFVPHHVSVRGEHRSPCAERKADHIARVGVVIGGVRSCTVAGARPRTGLRALEAVPTRRGA